MKPRLYLAVLALAVSLVGCGEPDAGPPPAVKTQETVNAQIEKIKADPNMSPQAKEAAIRGVQASFENSRREAEKMKSNPTQNK